MNAVERLDEYLQTLRRRLRTYICVRGAAVAAIGALVLLGAFVWWFERSGFAAPIALAGRIALAVFLVAIVLALVLWPLRLLRRDDGAHVFERKLIGQNGRVATYLDARRRGSSQSPLLELLAEDAHRIARATPVDSVVPARKIQLGALVTLLASAALILFVTLAPGFWGHGSRHLLFGAALPSELVPVRNILVLPGDATVRRNSDLEIRASLQGFQADEAAVFVRFADQQQWERAPMERVADSRASFAFKLYALRSPFKYYVESDGTRSAEHTVAVADLPRIDRMRLTFRYPEWTGLPTQVEEDSRDIRAVAGTQVDIEIQSDVPLENPTLVYDDGEAGMSERNGANAATLAVEKPGRYYIAAEVAGEKVALSEEYAIEIIPDEKPVVQIERPARDWRATNIEEVPVRVQAHDDFRLQKVELRYSVNGGEWRSLPLARNVQQTREQTLLELEKLGAEQKEKTGAPLLAPGDLVSYYAVARDHKHSVETDLFMVQVQPFERRFLQQSGGGGGGGMADEQGAISERQREILLATWNLQRSEANNRQTREQLRDNAKMLSEMQSTLAQQARTLATRTRARTQVEADEQIKTFVESLERAALAMDPAALHLGAFELDKAVPVEQQALQQLLRAEAAFREVQIAMQSEGGGQGSRTARDFSEMYELEMDVEKSQYESESQLSEERTNEEMEEALRKLKELAERQEQLAQQANRQNALTPEQRWQQEQLRREAEDLRRRLAAMNQRQQRSQQNDESQRGQQAEQQGAEEQEGQQDGQPGSEQRQASDASRGGQRSNDPRSNQRGEGQSALEVMDQALAQMQAANSSSADSPEQQARAAEEASKRLREAARQLDRPRGSGLDADLAELAQRASRLAQEQRRIESELYEALREGGQGGLGTRSGAIDPQRAQSLVQDKQQMAQELGELQKELRNSVHRHRDANEEAKRRLTEVVNELESSDLMYRVRRSAAEIYYGRARDAAAREGIITEGLQNLDKDLSEAVALARRQDDESKQSEGTTDRLLAEVADLRRRLEQQRRLQAANSAQSSSQQAQSQPRGENSAQPSESERGTQRGNAGADTRGDRALSAWDPIVPNAAAEGRQVQGQDSLARQTDAIADRARRIRERAGNRELTAAELQSLRGLARELRQLAGDPLNVESQAMRRAVSQIELTALAAVANSARRDAARTNVPVEDSPQYREAVAEYYRRLGGS